MRRFARQIGWSLLALTCVLHVAAATPAAAQPEQPGDDQRVRVPISLLWAIGAWEARPFLCGLR